MIAELFRVSTENPNYVREANVGPIKNGLYGFSPIHSYGPWPLKKVDGDGNFY